MAQMIDAGSDFTPPPITPEQAGNLLQSMGLPVSPIQNRQQGQDVAPTDTGTGTGSGMVPADRAGFSTAYVGGGDQVGYGPQARWNDANPDNYQTPDSWANVDVPANLLDTLKQDQASQDAPFSRSSDRPGIEPGQGGLARREDATYLSSDQLMRRVASLLPPDVASAFANRKIERPANVGDIYGEGRASTAGGYYDPATGRIVLARGNNDAYGNENVDVGGASHEILHATAFEGAGGLQADQRAGYPRLMTLVAQTGIPVKASLTDPNHVYTELADRAIRQPWTLPAPVLSYFAPLLHNYKSGNDAAPAQVPWNVQGSAEGYGNYGQPFGPAVQQQDAPPNSRDLGIGAKEAGLAAQSVFRYDPMLGSYPPKGDTSFHSQPNETIGNLLPPVIPDIVGKSADLGSLTNLGPKSDYFNSPQAMQNAIGMFNWTKAGSGGLADVHVPGQAVAAAKGAGTAAFDELVTQAAKVPSVESGFLRGEAGGLKLPGGGGDSASQYVVEAITGTGGKETYRVVDSVTGKPYSKTGGQVISERATADRVAARENAKIGVPAAKAEPTIADASTAFNRAAGTPGADFKRMATQFSTANQQAIRQSLRGERDLTPAETASVNAESSKILAGNQTPATPENVAALADAVRVKQQASNAASRPFRNPTAAEAVAEKNTAAVRQAVSDAITPAQVAKEADIRAGRAQPSDVIPGGDVVPGSQAALDTLGESPAGLSAPGPKINPEGRTIDQPSPRIPGGPIREPIVNQLLREGLGLMRANLVMGHLALLRQMLPGVTYALGKGRVDIVGRALGAMAHGVASDAPAIVERISGLKQQLADLGIDKTVFLNHPNAHVSQSEESMLVGRTLRTPGVTSAVGAVSGFAGADPNSTLDQRLERAAKGAAIGAAVGLSAGRLNQAYGMGINSLRTDLAVGLAKQYQKIGNVDQVTGKLTGPAANKVGHFVNILTGRGDLIEKLASKAGPDAREASKALQDAGSGLFFGPRLMTSTWQQAADTIGALHGIVPDAVHSVISGQPLDPARLAVIRSTASFVAFGTGIMALAKSQGLPIGTDTNKTDWGLIHLPDGSTVDMWGSYRTFARSIAQEITYGQQVATGTVPKGPYAKTGGSIVGSYLRGRLNPPAGVVADYLNNGTAIGQPPSLDPINPFTHPPFGVATAEYAFGAGDAHTPAGPGGLLGAGETALTALGAGVQPPTLTPHRDGLGRLDDGALPATPVTDAWDTAHARNPSVVGALVPTGRSVNMGTGNKPILLDDKETDALRVFTGTARSSILGQVVASPLFQNANPAQQAKMLVGAKIAADQQGRVQFALDHAKNATNDVGMVRAVTIGLHAATTTSSKLNFIAQLAQQNTLTDVAHNALDDLRTQPDPLKANYQPTVNEYLKGNDLISRYLAAPAFRAGTPQDWADAAKQGSALHAVYQTLQREAEQASTATKKVTVQQLPDYKNYIRDYNTARTSSNRPVSAFITNTGSVNPNMVTPQRLAIMKDPVFNHFLSVAKQRDPYSVK